jgi:ParB-like chromosome segregation protein Spo0J
VTLEYVHPDELKNHLTNLSIYGDTPDQELVESVRQYGVFEDHPIGYVQDGDFKRIVSGHRRNQAARITKQEMVPCIRLKDIEDDPLAIEERIILSNKQREKTREKRPS